MSTQNLPARHWEVRGHVPKGYPCLCTPSFRLLEVSSGARPAASPLYPSVLPLSTSHRSLGTRFSFSVCRNSLTPLPAPMEQRVHVGHSTGRLVFGFAPLKIPPASDWDNPQTPR